MEKIKKFLDNFWYYNKWKLAAGIVIVISVALCISQCASRENGDYTFVLFTYNDFVDEQLDKMADYFETYGEDLNGDGEVVVTFNNCSYDIGSTNQKVREARISKLQSAIIAEGKQLIYITDNKSFDYLNNLFDGAEIFVDVSLPDDDGKSLILGEDFYKKTEGNDVTLPEGFRVSVRTTDGIENVGNGKISGNLKDNITLLEKMAGKEQKINK